MKKQGERIKTPELAARGHHSHQVIDTLRAKSYLNEPGSLEEFVKVLLKDKELKKFPEFEEFRTGQEYKVNEVINFERLEDDEDVKALVDATKREKVVAKDEADEKDELEKIMPQAVPPRDASGENDE